jgi:asparagine synthase (glutamine-hydrolysing)
MPGLSGIVSNSTLEPADRPADLLTAFRRVHALDGVRFEHRSHLGPRAVIDIALTGLLPSNFEQPALADGGKAVLFLEGEVFNLEDLARPLSSPQGRSACSVLLALYGLKGPAFAELVDGNFNIVILEQEPDRLTILNDHVASKPLYYLEEKGRLLFGSEKKPILRVMKRPPVVDGLGLLQVFAHRHNLGGRTFIEGVRCLPPASRLEYREGRLSLAPNGGLRFKVPGSLPPARRLVEDGAERLQAAVTRRLRGKERIVLSLSGGLDSRAVACAIRRDLRPLWARTRGVPGSPDLVRATEIARHLGFQHLVEDPSDVPYSDVLPRIVWRTEGAVPFINCMSITHHNLIKERGDFLVGGQFGDVSSGAHIRPYMFIPRSRGAFLERAYSWYRVHPESTLRRIFDHGFLSRHEPLLREAFAESFERIEADGRIELYELWDLTERQARMTVGAAPVDSHLFEKAYPFLDKEYMSFALALPTRLRFGQAVYQAMIHRLGPEIRGVPNANTGRPLRGTVTGNRLETGLELVQKAVEKASRRAGLGRLPKTAKREASEGIAAAILADGGFRAVVEGFARSQQLDGAVFNGPGILDLVREHYEGGGMHAHLLSILATFALAIPCFVSGRASMDGLWERSVESVSARA